MPKQQHHPKDVKSYHQGANRDTEKELLGSLNQGEYVDARNFRPTASEGDSASVDKLLGEEVFHPNEAPQCIVGNNNPLPGSYLCIGSIEINDHIVEFWADEDGVEDSLIRVDGDVLLKTPDFPILTDFPLQIAKNESCIGGEVYITDYNTLPMAFNIGDLIKNECEQKYFGEFDLSSYQIILKSPLDHPIFIDLVTGSNPGGNLIQGSRVEVAGGGGTLPVGTYQYRIRYVTDQGDRTKLSVATPPIPVPSAFTSKSAQYPYVMTHGADPGITGFNIKIRFRVTNLRSYDFVEVARVRYTGGQSPYSTAVTEIVARIEIAPEEVSIIDFIDDNASSLETITGEEVTDVIKTLARAKAIRYFNKKLYLMNIEYQSREVKGVSFKGALNSESIYPTMENIGKAGHRDPWNFVNYKSHMHGERYGYAAVMLDASGERSFAAPLPQGLNFQMPERREPASQNTLNSISRGDGYQKTVTAADIFGNVNLTHEVFDLKEAVQKTDLCSFINISTTGKKLRINVNQYCGTKASTAGTKAKNIGLKPFTPKHQDDGNVEGHNFVVNTGVKTGTSPSWKYVDDGTSGYHPQGFGPRYFSLGVAIEGITNIPTWVEAIAIVRTNAAGRIVTQGLCYYNIKEGVFPKIGFGATPAGKESNSFWFHSPDIENGFVSESTIIDNLPKLRLQLVSPLGFFSEMYSGRNDLDANRDTHVDLISYVRILNEPGGNEAMNTGDSPTQVGFASGSIGTSGYVTYGKWRNPEHVPSQGTLFNSSNSQNGNSQLNISSFTPKTDGRSSYFTLTTAQAVYSQTQIGGINQKQFADGGLKKYHEPMYMGNIVNEFADVPGQNITEYIETGFYQKVSSIIGKSQGDIVQTYFLVDERWEDCHPDSNDPNRSNVDKYIFSELDDGTVKRYLNVTFKTVSQLAIIVADINTNGSFLDSNGNTVSGIYTMNDVYGNRRLFSIRFDNVSINGNSPQALAFIRVKYDDTAPLRVFGGDVTVNESTFAAIDRQGQNGGGSEENESANNPFFVLGLGFPYHRYQINPRYYQPRQTPKFVAGVDIEPTRIQDTDKLQLDYMRQMLAMYTVESRGDMGFLYHDRGTTNESFALKNYVVRPMKWKDDKNFAKNGIWHPYGGADHYPDTVSDYDTNDELPSGEWRWGGFKFNSIINFNYSQRNHAQFHFSKPAVGFVDENLFCTRIIWSEERDVNVQDSPGIKTFREESRFDISDAMGEIKYAFDAITPKGSNLYAITDSGICLLMTDKRILSDANASELAIIGTDTQQSILEQLWITKDIGMHDEMWRTAAEFDNFLFFANHSSVYSFDGGSLKDIGREGYHSILRTQVLDNIAPGYEDHITGTYDRLHNEYWLNYKREIEELDIDAFKIVVLVDPQYESDDVINQAVNEGDIVNLTGIFNSAGGGIGNPQIPVVTLNSLTPTYALTARTLTLCSTDQSDTVINIAVASNSGISILHTLEIGECICLTATVGNVTGQFQPGQGTVHCISFTGGVNLSAFSVGDIVTICYTNINTGLDVCEGDFIINNFTGGGQTICVDSISGELDLSHEIAGGTDVQILTPNVGWEFEACEVNKGESTYAYNVVNKHWNGQYDYRFDRYLAIKNRMYGMRDLSTFELNKGFQINGQDITASVTNVSAMEQMEGKEFIRIRVASDNKPTRVEFGDDPDNTTFAALDPTIQGALYLKDYRGFEQYIPRRQDGVNDRIQGRHLIFKVIHNLPEHFKIITTAIQYKVLK